jgi:hypothetical protein
MLQYALPMATGRGAGLGNELISWGKAYIASRVLNIPALHPAWGLNPRRYWQYFGTSRADWPLHQAMVRALPTFPFDDRFHPAAPGASFEDSFRRFAKDRGLIGRRSPFIVSFAGMEGGWEAISDAREFLRAQLLNTRGTLANLYETGRAMQRRPIRIGLHIRRGDFTATDAGTDYRGRFNLALPLDWYQAVVADLHRQLGDEAAYLIVSDATPDELAPLTRLYPAVTTSHQRMRDVSDMMALADCDLIVCSVSSFSMWAAFFSEGRYLWFAPQLSQLDGFYGIWAHQAGQQAAGSLTRNAMATHTTASIPRGVPIGRDGRVPADVIADLAQRAAIRDRAQDLIQYGVLPVAPLTGG